MMMFTSIRLCIAPLFLCRCAGPLYNTEGVLLHLGATIIWQDGRRANFQCGFDQALTQYLEVRLQCPCVLLVLTLYADIL